MHSLAKPARLRLHARVHISHKACTHTCTACTRTVVHAHSCLARTRDALSLARALAYRNYTPACIHLQSLLARYCTPVCTKFIKLARTLAQLEVRVVASTLTLCAHTRYSLACARTPVAPTFLLARARQSRLHVLTHLSENEFSYSTGTSDQP